LGFTLYSWSKRQAQQSTDESERSKSRTLQSSTDRSGIAWLPFAPVHYARWPYRTPGTLYGVRYVSPSTH
jgi:hypothetical protein